MLGQVVIENGDRSYAALEIIPLIYSHEDILREAELAEDITDAEWTEFGEEAFIEAMESLYKKIRSNITWKCIGSSTSEDGIDVYTIYEIFYEEAIPCVC